jgi:hypothetical protein
MKKTFDSLTQQEQTNYILKAQDLINRHYVVDLTAEELAEEIFKGDMRKQNEIIKR